jgi:hypothetical protein
MPILEIRKWYGRLGNNIVQVINTIFIALYYKNLNIKIPLHNFFNKEFICINNDISFNDYSEFESNEFFYQDHTMKSHSWVIPECFETNIEESLQTIRDLFLFKFNQLEALGENDLTIHIRSGDIFYLLNPNDGYTQPPLSYYIDIIESSEYKNKNKNIYLVCEDKLNPCVNKLLELYPDIHFSINDIVDDVKLLMRSTNVISSNGTFVPALLNMTDYTKKIYTPSYFSTFNECLFNNTAEIIKIDLDEYKSIMGPWKNTQQQREIMLTYTMSP